MSIVDANKKTNKQTICCKVNRIALFKLLLTTCKLLTLMIVVQCPPNDRNQHLWPLAVPTETIRSVWSIVLARICTIVRTPHSHTLRAALMAFPVFACNRIDHKLRKICEYLPCAGDRFLSLPYTPQCLCLSNVFSTFSVCFPAPFPAIDGRHVRRRPLYVSLVRRSMSASIVLYLMASMLMTMHWPARCQCSMICYRLYWNWWQYLPCHLLTTDYMWQLYCMDYGIELLALDWIQCAMSLCTSNRRTKAGRYLKLVSQLDWIEILLNSNQWLLAAVIGKRLDYWPIRQVFSEIVEHATVLLTYQPTPLFRGILLRQHHTTAANRRHLQLAPHAAHIPNTET